MKTVLIINQFANTPDLPGHTRQFEIAKGLQNKGWRVEVYSSDFNLSERKFKKLKKFDFLKYELIKNINWFWIRVFPYKKNNFFRYINIFSFCINLFFVLFPRLIFKKFYKNEKLIILASSPQILATFLCLILSKIFSVPFISEIRDLWPQVLIDLGNKDPESFLIKIISKIEKIIYSNSEHVVVLAEGSIKYVKGRGAKKVSFLPNGSDLNIFTFRELLPEPKNFSQKRPFNLLYCGAHGKANGLIHVINAAKILINHPIKFILMGDGPTKKNLVKQSSDLKNILFCSPEAKSKMPSIIAKSDAMLLTLKNIPLFEYGVSPNKLYDAYAIGRPVINNVGGNIAKEIKEHNIGINALPENPKSLSEAIVNLMNSPRKLRENMSKRARILAETKYSRQIVVDKYIKILNDYI